MEQKGNIEDVNGFFFEKEPDMKTPKSAVITKHAAAMKLKAKRRRTPEERAKAEQGLSGGYQSNHRRTRRHSKYYKSQSHSAHHLQNSSHSSGRHSGKSSHSSSHSPERSSGSSSARGKKKKTSGRKALKIILSIVAVLLVITMIPVGAYFIMRERGKKDFTPAIIDSEYVTVDNAIFYDEGKTLTYNGKMYEYNENVVPVAFLGVDKFDMEDTTDIHGRTGSQSDMNMVAAFDTKTGELTVIAIPRDTLVDVNVYDDDGNYIGIQPMQLCLSYSYGDGEQTSCENTVLSIERLLCGIEINNYIALEVNSIGVMADAVGGVELVSIQTIGDFVEGESYVLTGELAKEYVQIRDTSVFNSDALRRSRQIQYVKAFGKKVYSQVFSDFSTVTRLYSVAKEHIYSNLGIENITYLASVIIENGNFSMDDIRVIDGEAVMDNGFMVVRPDSTSVFETVLSVFYKEAESAE